MSIKTDIIALAMAGYNAEQIAQIMTAPEDPAPAPVQEPAPAPQEDKLDAIMRMLQSHAQRVDNYKNEETITGKTVLANIINPREFTKKED